MSYEKVIGQREFCRARLDALLFTKAKTPLRIYESFLTVNYMNDPAPSPRKVDVISSMLRTPTRAVKGWFQRRRCADYKANKLCRACKKFFVAENQVMALCVCQEESYCEVAGLTIVGPSKGAQSSSALKTESSFTGPSKASSAILTLPSANGEGEAATTEKVAEIFRESTPLDLRCTRPGPAAGTPELEIAEGEVKYKQLFPVQCIHHLNEQLDAASTHRLNNPRNLYLESLPGYPLVKSILCSMVKCSVRPNPPTIPPPMNQTPPSVQAFQGPSNCTPIMQPLLTSSPLPSFRTFGQPFCQVLPWHLQGGSPYRYFAGDPEVPVEQGLNFAPGSGTSAEQSLGCFSLE